MANKKTKEPSMSKKKAKEPSGEIVVEFHPAWLDYIVPERFNNPELNRIVTFFVFHSPCVDLSAMSRSLDAYGWTDPWKKPIYLQKKLKNASTNPELLYSAQTLKDMKQALDKSGLNSNFPDNLLKERVAVYNNMHNQFMSVFYHIRDAFAHGRLNMVDIGESDDYVFVMEDVRKQKGVHKVSARIILRKSTLLKWIDIIEQGP